MTNVAVIRAGGKQYIVSPNKRIRIEKIAGNEGDAVSFSDVLLMEGEGGVVIGKPRIDGTVVRARILKQGRAKKVIVFKYRPKKRYRVKRGHRQRFTEVKMESIEKPN